MNAFHTAELARLRAAPILLQDEELPRRTFSGRLIAAYEPIIGVRSGEVIGVQAAASYWTGNRGRSDTKHELDTEIDQLALKRRQIALAPDHGWLMLDLDAGRFLKSGKAAQHALLQLLRQYVWSAREIIVNLVCADSDRLSEVQGVADRLQSCGLQIAVEESGLRRGLFSLATLLDATIVKFDSSILRLRTRAAVNTRIEVLLRVAREAGIQVVMTGVDHAEHYQWARKMGVDGVQGRLFRHSRGHRQ